MTRRDSKHSVNPDHHDSMPKDPRDRLCDAGRFLVFEGLDGSGKSTLIQGLAAEIHRQNRTYVLTREPGGTKLAESLRHLLLSKEIEPPVPQAELLMYEASRAQHVAKVIRPALDRGEWVLCDRFSASTVAFQCFARELPRSDVDWLNRYAQQGTHPSLYVLLDLEVEESQRRQVGRRKESGQDEDRMEAEAKAFHEAVRRGYLEQAKEDPERWIVLDATLSKPAILDALLARLREMRWLD